MPTRAESLNRDAIPHWLSALLYCDQCAELSHCIRQIRCTLRFTSNKEYIRRKTLEAAYVSANLRQSCPPLSTWNLKTRIHSSARCTKLWGVYMVRRMNRSYLHACMRRATAIKLTHGLMVAHTVAAPAKPRRSRWKRNFRSGNTQGRARADASSCAGGCLLFSSLCAFCCWMRTYRPFQRNGFIEPPCGRSAR